MSLVFHTSNRLENLTAVFAEHNAERYNSPFVREIIVVQTMGMGRYLSLRLADYCGISANLEFLFPNAVIDRLFGLILPELTTNTWPDQPEMVWQIMELLPELCRSPQTAEVFSPVNNYLQDDDNGLKLYQLAGKIADIFDQYQVYRPEMILAWDKGTDWFKRHPSYDKNHAWQQILWHYLRADKNIMPHRAFCGQKFITRMADQPTAGIAGLPDHITIFGVSVIPRFHLQIFEAAARAIAIDFFLLSPCREYWGYIKTSKEIKRAERQSGKHAGELLLAEVNPLLASQGILGRDFLNMILELDHYELKENFEDTAPESCLKTIQADLLNLVNPFEKEHVPDTDPADGSIQFHSCHGPLREIEVLYDQLLKMLAADRSLSPADILVMTPDLATYAPLIRVVFANPYNEQTRLPFSIADTGSSQEQTIMTGLDNILRILQGRFQAPEILGLLDNPIIAAEFSFTTQDIATIRGWLQGAGIRWGINQEMMREQGLPGLEEINWQSGCQRLLMGYAMAAESEAAFDNIYPFTDFNENDSLLLGNFLDFFELLITFRNRIKGNHSLREWQKILLAIQENFFSNEPPFADAGLIAAQIIADLTGEKERKTAIKLDVKIIRAALRERYQGKLHSRGFMGSGITFCAMLPMRSIPFKIIAMIGMNDTTFPRLKKNLEFDLTIVEPRPGDRNPRENDKYLFLETFISARKIFYLSFCGQSLRNNNPVPPSVLVSELLDYLAGRYKLNQEKQKKLITRHRLQPFNKKYFEPDSRLHSFSEENCLAARAKTQDLQTCPSFFAHPLSSPRQITTITLAGLIAFFKHPVKFLYNRVLGIYLDNRDEIISGAEIFVPGALEAYQLKEELMARPDGGPAAVRARATMLAACGRMPLGNPGVFYRKKLEEEIIAWQNRLAEYLAAPLPPTPINISLDSGININGVLTDLYRQCQLLFRPTKLGAGQGRNGFKINRKKDLIQGWILHLALNCQADTPRTTMIAGIDHTAALFPPLKGARELLSELVKIYLAGQERIIPFFPQYSLALSEGDKVEKLPGHWLNDKYDGAADIYNSHCFGETIPLDDEFIRLAAKIGTPLYQQVTTWQEA
jgi:exodeoxyribonuclease V gamma subunit